MSKATVAVWQALKNLFKKEETNFELPGPAVSPKMAATMNNEPWVDVVQVNVDTENVGNGSFTLDFNDIFVARLVKAGYKGKNDYEVVDNWFTDICRNIVLETFEQEISDPDKRETFNRSLGNGRTEFK